MQALAAKNGQTPLTAHYPNNDKAIQGKILLSPKIPDCALEHSEDIQIEGDWLCNGDLPFPPSSVIHQHRYQVIDEPSTQTSKTGNCAEFPLWLQLSQAQHALQYEEALRSASVSSIEPILRELGSGGAPAIEVEDFKSLGKTRVMILDANRQRLLRCKSGAVRALNCT